MPTVRRCIATVIQDIPHSKRLNKQVGMKNKTQDKAGRSISVFIDRQRPFADTEMCRNKDTSIMLVKTGTAHIEIDFKPYTLKAGHMLMLPPSCLFCCKSQSDDFTVSGIAFSQEITEELTSRFEPTYFAFMTEYPVGNIPADDITHINHMMQGVEHILNKPEQEHAMQIAQLLIQCFYLDQYDYCRKQIAQRPTMGISNQEKLLMRFITLIHEHAATHRELSFYSDKLCISNRYLSAIVHKQTGRTAKEFIDQRCIQEIKIRLRTTQETIQNIADLMNFPDQSFFCRYFKKNTGITPKEFRAN